VDRFSRVYTPVVVTVAVALAVVPPVLGASFGDWFYRALALLVIACPCALVISTPVTVVSGTGAASRRGILVKEGAALEAAGRLKALAFDKTGTLTEGRPTVSRVVALGGLSEVEAVRFAAGTDVALETADVALMQDDLPKLAEAVRLSRSAELIIRQNVAASILIKGLFVLLASFGLVAL
jgi:cation transport ATPase